MNEKQHMFINFTDHISKHINGKVLPMREHVGPEGELVSRCYMGGGWLKPHSGRFTLERETVPIVQEIGWALGPVWTGAENLVPTRVQTPKLPVQGKSLY
jgi:hypothetical protein